MQIKAIAKISCYFSAVSSH